MVRYGFQPIIGVGKETNYGVAVEPTIKIFSSFQAEEGIEEVGIPHKTTFPYDITSEYQAGRKSAKITLSGVLTDSHEFLLAAFTGTASTAYALPATGLAPTTYYYTIMHAFPAATADAGDGEIASGCVLESVTFSKNGDYVNFSAVFRTQDMLREQDLAAYDFAEVTVPASSANCLYKAPVPFLWHRVTSSLIDGSITQLDNFTLTLTNEFVDDDASFQNNQNRLQATGDPICFHKGTFSATTVYDTVFDAKIFNHINGVADTYVQVISFVNGNKTWAFTMNTQYIAPYDLPDDTKCRYRSTWNCRLIGDGTAVPLSVAVS